MARGDSDCEPLQGRAQPARALPGPALDLVPAGGPLLRRRLVRDERPRPSHGQGEPPERQGPPAVDRMAERLADGARLPGAPWAGVELAVAARPAPGALPAEIGRAHV